MGEVCATPSARSWIWWTGAATPQRRRLGWFGMVQVRRPCGGWGKSWLTRAWSSMRPRPASCSWRWEARGLISSAFSTGWVELGDGKEPGVSSSSPAGPHAEPASTPVNASAN
jgi:hypothetical protein